MNVPKSSKELFQFLSDLIGAVGGVLFIIYSYQPENRTLFVVGLFASILSAAWDGNIWMKTVQALMLFKIILIDRNLVRLDPPALYETSQLNTLWWFGLAYAVLNFAQGIEFLGDVLKKIGGGIKKVREFFDKHDVS